MSILPRFPPFRKLTGRDYNLICDTVEGYLSSLSQVNLSSGSAISGGVSQVLAGSGVSVAPITGDVVITKVANDLFPYTSNASASFSGSNTVWTTWPMGTTEPETVNAYFSPLVNNSIWTFIMWTDAPFTFVNLDTSLDLRLIKNGVEMTKGTTQLVNENQGFVVNGAGDVEYQYNFQLMTTQILQAADRIDIQVLAPTGGPAFNGVGLTYIRWA